jgi:hypothetical protein
MKKFAPRNNLEADQIMDGDYRSPLSRIEFEKSEPIVRLLAQVRKVGMDILFPQSTHDKVRQNIDVLYLFIQCFYNV